VTQNGVRVGRLHELYDIDDRQTPNAVARTADVRHQAPFGTDVGRGSVFLDATVQTIVPWYLNHSRWSSSRSPPSTPKYELV